MGGSTMKRQTMFFAAWLTTIALGACADESPTTERQSAAALEARQETLERKPLQRVDSPEAPVTGEVPEAVLETLREDLAARGVSNASVVLAESTVWPNGAMGCPEPGRMYTQALIDGYRVVFERGSDRWDYRVSARGGFMLCERGMSLQSPGGNPKK